MAFYYRARSVTQTNGRGTVVAPQVPVGVEYVARLAPTGGGSQPWGIKTPVALPTPVSVGLPVDAYIEAAYALAVSFCVANGVSQVDLDLWGGWGP